MDAPLLPRRSWPAPCEASEGGRPAGPRPEGHLERRDRVRAGDGGRVGAPVEGGSHQGYGLEQPTAGLVRQADHSQGASGEGAGLLHGPEGDRVRWVTTSSSSRSATSKRGGTRRSTSYPNRRCT